MCTLVSRYCSEQYSAHLFFALILPQISFRANRSTIAKNRILSQQYQSFELVLQFAVIYVLDKIGLDWTFRVSGFLQNRGLLWRKLLFAGLLWLSGLLWNLVVFYTNKWFAIPTSGLLYSQVVCDEIYWLAMKKNFF